MTFSKLGPILKAIIAAIPRAVADYKANAARPAGQGLTGAQAAAAARKAQAWLAQAIPFLEQHPGIITAADDILGVVAANGFSVAGDAKAALDGATAAGAAIEKALPEIIWALGAFEPSATGITGDAKPWGQP